MYKEMQVFRLFFVSIISCVVLTNGFECITPKVAKTVIVSQSEGQGQFSKVQDAINSIPSENKEWIRVLVYPGTYKEQVQISRDKQCVILQGNSQWNTIISFDAHEATDTSATFSSFADNFLAKNIAFENSYGNKNGVEVKQAVAARIYGDKSAFYWCRFLGLQDTLWDVSGRHYYKSCGIQGAIDFIWGSGQSVFEDCLMRTISGRIALGSYAGFITAQGRKDESDPSGFVFIRGKVYGYGRTFLGRAYGTHARVIFQQTYMENLVVPEGWYAWHALHNEGNVTFTESRCRGPGAALKKRVPWMKTLPDARSQNKYTVRNFIDQDRWISKQPNWR